MKRRILVLLFLIAAVATAVFWPRYPDNRIPTPALHALETDSSLTLYSLDPLPLVVLDSGDIKPLPDDVPKFQGYRILGQTTLTSPDSRRVAVSTVRDAVRNWDGALGACFEPRHGIRVTDASGTYDFLICFACRQVDVISPGEVRTGLGIRASSQPLDDILTAAHVPLPTR